MIQVAILCNIVNKNVFVAEGVHFNDLFLLVTAVVKQTKNLHA